MPSKEEIEKIKRGLTEELGRTIIANECGLSTNDFSESIEILEGALKYIKQLESREQKLIEKLENRIKELNNKSGGNTFYVQSIINAEKRENEEILKILKGENDE